MTLQQIADEYERRVNANEIIWVPVDKSRLATDTQRYLEMWLDEAKVSYMMASDSIGGTHLFKIDDEHVTYLHMDPARSVHMWAGPGFHEALPGNVALAHFAALAHGVDEADALVLFDAIDAKIILSPDRN